MDKVVIALGGNALGMTPTEQQNLWKKAVKNIVPLIKKGDKVIITHGNGPQVGIINLAFEDSYENKDIPYMPMAECTAMSQGYIGYHIEKALKKELLSNEIDKNVVTVITEILVSENDKAFLNPTKPIGPFYTKKEADRLAKETGETYIEDSNRGYRKVVASPKPLEIVQIDTINKLVDDSVVIACGGGGIPIFKNSKKGANAVIDKDLASSLLAKEINADVFIILTSVDQSMLNFNQENEKPIGRITVEELKEYVKEGHFAKGSMLPKINACISFVEETGNKAIITSLNNLNNGIRGRKATIITK